MEISGIRPPAVAGLFYPDAAPALADEVGRLIAAVPPAPTFSSDITPASGHESSLKLRFPQPKAIIVPHAGYMYSGAVAARAYALLGPHAGTIRRVALFGPCHRVAVRGLAVPHARAFATPLGAIRLDREAIASALQLPQVIEHDAAHAEEHALEVQLPFLQAVLDDFTLAPFAVGYATPDEVAEVLDLFGGGAETLLVISSDLSHYHGYAEAQRRDRQTADDILHLRLLANHEQACGATPINGLIELARRRGLKPRLLDLRNSGDTAGDRARVVGYASFAFTEDRG
ncbi:MAG: AmmeMemoRadiSam system protein B [Sulfuritalea sp.]|nr:AmmeMemoRadiSam system protein B [Sulfuritalea sp.]